MGQYESRVKALGNEQLLAGLASIVHRRNQITAEFLAYLAELDERQLFLDLGFSSLFEYCVERLKLCESTAGRHIAAARVCRNHPEAFAMVASGVLHASALSLLRKHLTTDNAAALFELCAHRSARKVEELLAARFPRPDVRDLVRRLPARANVTLNVESATEQISTEALASESMAEGAPKAALASEQRLELAKAPSQSSLHDTPLTPRAAEGAQSRRIEPLSTDRFGVHFTADGEFCALLERVRGLAGHRLPSGDLMTLLKRGLEAYERELEKQRFAVGGKVRRKRGATAAPLGTRGRRTRKRYYPAAVKRAVFLRDGKQCSYLSREGRRCGARRCLELDHVRPRAAGGENTIENLRLRCRAHNQRYARQFFGKARVDAAIKNSRRQRAGVRDGQLASSAVLAAAQSQLGVAQLLSPSTKLLRCPLPPVTARY